jgi:uncharacterized protein (TIGR03437 family)
MKCKGRRLFQQAVGLFVLAAALQAQTGTGSAGPQILNNGIVSSASFTPAQAPGGAIPQGSIFSIFGSNLGPTASAQQPSFPLTNTLAGVSITVVAGAANLNAIPVYVSPTLINAVMPSNAPVGKVAVQVTFNGTAGNTVTVAVVANQPMVYTATGAGVGPAILQNYIPGPTLPINAASRTVMPGQLAFLYLTGLGAITGADNEPPPNGTLPYQTEVWIGGVPVTDFRYAGRSPCCSGLDEIIFAVPATAPSGCFVPVMVRVAGTAVSNTTTLAIDPNGNPCSDPISGAYTKGGKFGTVALVRRLIHVASANPPDLIVDVGMGAFSQEAGADYSFNSLVSLPPPGACATYEGTGNYFVADSSFATPSAKGLQTGTLTVKGPSGSVPLISAADLGGANEYIGLLGSSGVLQPGQGPAPFLNPGQYTITGGGGADVGGFSVSLTVPAGNSITWTNRNTLTTVNRSQPLTFTWTGTSYLVSLEGINYDVPTNTSTAFRCIAPAGATSFTVPSWILTNMGTTRTNALQSRSLIGIASATAPATFQATGLNNTVATYVLLQATNVTFQ